MTAGYRITSGRTTLRDPVVIAMTSDQAEALRLVDVFYDLFREVKCKRIVSCWDDAGALIKERR